MTAKLIQQMQKMLQSHGKRLMRRCSKVDEAGKVTALKAGKATIMATAVQGEKESYGQCGNRS